MIFLSYNCRGLASQPKKLVLRELVKAYNPDVILMQETLGQGGEVKGSLSKIFPGWIFHALDANGRSGGVASRYKVGKFKEISSWGFKNSLAIELYSNEFCHPFLLLNVYGPCSDRERFWNPFFMKSYLYHPNLIVWGDLNFSLGASESWGASARVDPLTEFFINKLAASHLVDSSLLKPRPT